VGVVRGEGSLCRYPGQMKAPTRYGKMSRHGKWRVEEMLQLGRYTILVLAVSIVCLKGC